MNTGKTALITGALSDIGQAMSEELAKSGYSIILNYRNNEALAAEFAASLNKKYPEIEVFPIKADVCYRSQITEMFERAHKQFKSIDVLINNAGINRDAPMLEMTEEDWNTVISTILTGSFFCAQEFAKRYQGSNGNIINIGATTALSGRKNGANYCSARAGVLALTKCLAIELAPQIRVNTITPGRIDTEELRTRYRKRGQNLNETVDDIPLKRIGTPAEIASIIKYIIQEGNYITGQNFIVDGGLKML